MNPLFLPALPLLTFVTAALFVLALFPPRSMGLRRRLAPYGPTHRLPATRERALAGSFVHRVLGPFGLRLVRLAASTAPSSIRAEAARELARAGQPLNVETYLALRMTAMLLLPVMYVWYVKTSGKQLDLGGVLMVAGLFLAGSRGSAWWIRSRTQTRQLQLERALPSALDLITVCMEAGLSFDSGLAKVVEKTRGPLAQEFERVLQDMHVGKPRREALHELAERAEVRDLSGFVAAIVQADQMGMSLAPVMRAQADEVRTRRRQGAEEQAMKASVKMLFPLIFFILPSMVLVVLGPGVVSLFRDILGQMQGLSY